MRAHVAAAGEDDLVAHDERLVLTHHTAHGLKDLAGALHEPAREVVLQTTDAREGVVHPARPVADSTRSCTISRSRNA